MLTLALLVFWEARILTVPRDVLPLEAADLFLYFLPSYTFIAERLRELSLPFWNPYQAAGQPFLATMQPGALYPARLLLLLLPVPTAMHVSTLGHLVLVLLGTYALCRQLGADRVGAVGGALVFTGAFGFPNLYWPSYLEAGAWLPVGALALTRLAATLAWRWVVLLGLASAMPVLAGGYQMTLYVGYGLALFGVALMLDRRRRGTLLTRGGLGRLLLAALLAVGSAAPQLLPTLAWTTETVRQTTRLTDVQIMPFPNPWWGVRETFLPNLGWSPFHLSLPAAALALAGFLSQRTFGAVLGTSTLALYLISLGPGTPFFRAYLALPGLAVFRSPRRLFTLVAFFGAIGAAFGLRALARALGARRGRLAEATALVLLVAALFGLLSNRAPLPWTVGPTTSRSAPDLIAALKQASAGGRAALPGNTLDIGEGIKEGMMQRVSVLQDYEPLSSRRLGAYLHAMVGLPPPAPEAVQPFIGTVPFTQPIARPELLDLLAVRSLLLPAAVRPPVREPPLTSVFGTAKFTLYGNPHALPRAFTVTRARFVEDEQAALATVCARDFDGRREAVLVGRPETALLHGPRTPFRAARIVDDQPERVTVEVAVEEPSLLVLADAYAPGWSAAVDGAARTLHQANHYVRGVAVHSGDRRVEFSYRPPGFAAGVAAAALAWGALGFAVALTRRR